MNNAITKEFGGKSRVFLPVIHLPEDGRLGRAAVKIALDAGADGVFLINQGTSTDNITRNLIPAYRKEFGADLWIGVNPLGTSVEQFILRSGESPETRIDGVWSDDSGVDSLRTDAYIRAKDAYLEARKNTGWKGLYFGGTAFKTQRDIPADKLALVATRAASFMEVVCTSGRGTGIAADVPKVKAMRETIPTVPMALASGISPENVDPFLPYVEAYLVATGIEKSFGVLDPARTKALADKIHGYRV
jgi:hypothetical protein